MFPVFLDTCVLLKPYLCDTLLSVAEAGVYRPLWSPMVMAELEHQLDLRPAEVIDALRRQVSRHHREPRTIEALLAILGSPGSGCPDFVLACHQML